MAKRLTEKQKQENLRKLIEKREKQGRVVVFTLTGLASMKIDDIINQPIEGLLYDLNRLPETIWTYLDDPKWVNDYACYLVIKKLYESWKQRKGE